MKEITIEVWGDFAAFNAPYAKVERLTYPFPTPSAARGILSAIYMKPKEFRWQINRIEVLNPIRYISFKRNEIKYTVSSEQISTEEERTQRQTTALQDVRYRIAASIIPRTAFAGKEIQLYEQALRRIRNGKCFHQPELGMREFVCYFEESDGMRQPIQLLVDVFQRVAVIAAVHQNISAAGGEHFAPAIWIAETGNETLADLFPVRNLQCFRFSADTVPL